LDLLIEGFKRSPKTSLIFPIFRGKKGHPVLIPSFYRAEILEHADGDFGCSYLFENHPDQLVGIPVESEGVLLDVDEPKDLERFGGLHAP
jgi:CTP:molybdopterin cytidylyltransferase MocA